MILLFKLYSTVYDFYICTNNTCETHIKKIVIEKNYFSMANFVFYNFQTWAIIYSKQTLFIASANSIQMKCNHQFLHNPIAGVTINAGLLYNTIPLKFKAV